MAGKLDGAAALMSLTRQDPLRYFIGFGSIGGRYGGNGLSDYATANDMFAKLCQWYRVAAARLRGVLHRLAIVGRRSAWRCWATMPIGIEGRAEDGVHLARARASNICAASWRLGCRLRKS